jgi:hypothetical protein
MGSFSFLLGISVFRAEANCKNGFNPDEVSKVVILEDTRKKHPGPCFDSPDNCYVLMKDGTKFPFLSPAPEDKDNIGFSVQCDIGIDLSADGKTSPILSLPKYCNIAIHKAREAGKERLPDCVCENTSCEDDRFETKVVDPEAKDANSKSKHSTSP